MSARYDFVAALPQRGFMRLINQFGDELAIGDTVVHSATDTSAKSKPFQADCPKPQGRARDPVVWKFRY